MVVGELLTCILLEQHEYDLSKLVGYHRLVHALGFDLPGARLTSFRCDRSTLISHVMMVLVLQIV